MEHVLWKDEYAIGDSVIDAQHMQLFRKVGILLDLLDQVEDMTEKKSEIDDLINYLEVYCLFHFGVEEKYQQKVNYVDYEIHKKIHKTFAKQISEHKQELEQNLTKEGVADFGHFLIDWLIQHICICDQCILDNKPLNNE